MLTFHSYTNDLLFRPAKDLGPVVVCYVFSNFVRSRKIYRAFSIRVPRVWLSKIKTPKIHSQKRLGLVLHLMVTLDHLAISQ